LTFRDTAIALCSRREEAAGVEGARRGVAGMPEVKPTMIELPAFELQTKAQLCFNEGSTSAVAVLECVVRIKEQVVITFNSFDEGSRVIDIFRHVFDTATKDDPRIARPKQRDGVVFTATGLVDRIWVRWLENPTAAFAAESKPLFISIGFKCLEGNFRGSSCGAWFGEIVSTVSARFGRTRESIANELVVKLLINQTMSDAKPSLSWSIATNYGEPITPSQVVHIGWRVCCVVGYTFFYELARSKVYSVARELMEDTLSGCTARTLLAMEDIVGNAQRSRYLNISSKEESKSKLP
jgi:hypothetical protein